MSIWVFTFCDFIYYYEGVHRKFITSLGSILLIFLIFLGIKGFSQKNFCANQISCVKNVDGRYDSRSSIGQYLGKVVSAPLEIANVFPPKTVLGLALDEKRIEINLSNQHLYAYQGDKLVYDFPVSSGKWAETPTGTFNIWIKLRYTRMEGGNPAIGTYYNLPNVPYTMYFYNDQIPKTKGYGIHGAYWHNNFGHPMSHGCVNMRTEEVEKLYYWTDPSPKKTTTFATDLEPGTKVIIYGTTPKE